LSIEKVNIPRIWSLVTAQGVDNGSVVAGLRACEETLTADAETAETREETLRILGVLACSR